MKKTFVFCAVTAVFLLSFSCTKKEEPAPAFDPGPSVIPADPDDPGQADEPETGFFSGGRGTEDAPYLISRQADLLQLRDLIDSESYEDFADKCYLQTEDIDFEGGDSRTISTESSQVFMGIYDGGGFAIRNAVFNRAYDRVGLFGGCDGATVKRLHFINCSVTQGKRGVGLVAGWANNTTIEDCHVEGGSIVSKWTAVGSLVGEGKGITVRNCSSDATISGSNGSAYSGAGGIVGYIDKVASTISNCQFTGTVTTNGDASETVEISRAGGIVGSLSSVTAVIEDCRFQGTVCGPAGRIGGIAGDITGTVRIRGCRVLSGARIESESGIAGGIVGNVEAAVENPGSVRSCSVEGATIASGDWGCAGLVARNYGMHVSSCQLSSTSVHATGNNAAGVSAITKYNLRFTDCSVTACTIVSDAVLAGGIVAEFADAGDACHNYVVGCTVSGSKVQSRYYTGGIAGQIKQGNVLDRCYVMDTDVISTNGGEAGGIAGKTAADGIVIINSMFWGGSVAGTTGTSGIGGIVGSFLTGKAMSAGQTLSTTVVANCMAHPSSVSNTNAASSNFLIGGVAGYMAYARMVNSYSPIAADKLTGAGTDAEDKRGSLYGKMVYGGELLNCYWLEGFKAGYADPSGTYTQKTQKARDTQMQQKDATSNVFWVPTLYPDGDYRKSNMTQALNRGAELYNADAPLYGVAAGGWVMTSAYPYPVLAGSPLDAGAPVGGQTRVGIIGDSISTFKGWKGGSYQYPKEGLYESFTVQDTWWYQLIYSKMKNACLDINTSSCGSTVQEHDSKGQPSFLDRYTALVAPDIILINGGTNDSWSYRLPLGSLDFSLSLTELDDCQFAQAYDKLVRLLRRDHPDAGIVLMIGDCLRDYPAYAQVIKDLAEHYQLHTVEIDFGTRRSSLTYQRTGTSDVNVHPNIAGMKEMAEQAWAQMSAWL